MKERVGDRIRALRKERDLTIRQVADAVGTGVGTIGDLETGKAENPRGDTLLALAKFFKVTPTWLQTGKGERDVMARNEDEEMLLDLFRALPPQVRRQMLKLGMALKDEDEADQPRQDEERKPARH